VARRAECSFGFTGGRDGGALVRRHAVVAASGQSGGVQARRATLRGDERARDRLMDTAILHALNGFASHHDGVEDPLSLYVGASEILFAGALALLVLAGGWMRRAAIAGGLAAGLALACGQVVSRIVDRPRPFVADPAGVHLFARHVADASFPSDHATAAFAIAVAVLLRNRRWGVVALAFATLLAVGRVALGLHYPSDVLGGALLGAGVSLLLFVTPMRARIDALADAAGRLVDRVLPRRPLADRAAEPSRR
jgi:undecaprenyl-diphosphatase